MSIAPAWHGVHRPSLEWNQSIHLTDLRCSSNWLQRCRFYRPEVECTPAWGGTHSGLRWGARRSEMGCVLAWDGVCAGLRWSANWLEMECVEAKPETGLYDRSEMGCSIVLLQSCHTMCMLASIKICSPYLQFISTVPIHHPFSFISHYKCRCDLFLNSPSRHFTTIPLFPVHDPIIISKYFPSY